MPEALLHEFAPAKINLALHVLGRRDDGYHELESLVAFAGIGDRLTLEPSSSLSLRLTGPMAPLLADSDGNLVLKAMQALSARKPHLRTGAFTLEKNLPVASGIGGGSADAAAALRLAARANGLALNDPDILAVASVTGADVPVCLDGRARIMRGVGEKLGAPLALPEIAAILINPGIGVSTPAVFEKLGLEKGEPFQAEAMPSLPALLDIGALVTLLQTCRNDLEAPAIAIAPAVRTALDSLAKTENCLLARMSGSGATTFGLYPDDAAAEYAAQHLSASHPDWWIRATRFRQ